MIFQNILHFKFHNTKPSYLSYQKLFLLKVNSQVTWSFFFKSWAFHIRYVGWIKWSLWNWKISMAKCWFFSGCFLMRNNTSIFSNRLVFSNKDMSRRSSMKCFYEQGVRNDSGKKLVLKCNYCMKLYLWRKAKTLLILWNLYDFSRTAGRTEGALHFFHFSI